MSCCTDVTHGLIPLTPIGLPECAKVSPRTKNKIESGNNKYSNILNKTFNNFLM